jgi:glyoxylase-like metal-dependent hydrolase (beta-lactamase superfamily II)
VNIIPVFAHNPGPYTGAGNLTYLITGRVPVLIDAGVGHDAHLAAVHVALDGAPLASVVVTHAHPDHADGTPHLLARHPSARAYKFPWPDRDLIFGVAWGELHDGDRVPAGESELEVVHTPGHSPDHICLFDSASRTLFGADLLVLRSTVVIPASYGGSLAQYLASLERVTALDPARVLPAHGPAIESPVPLIRDYLAHREARERQIVAALAKGARTPDTIVPMIYTNLHPDLLAAAAESVLAHLIKLQDEGRASRDEDGWQLTA